MSILNERLDSMFVIRSRTIPISSPAKVSHSICLGMLLLVFAKDNAITAPNVVQQSTHPIRLLDKPIMLLMIQVSHKE